MKTINLKFLSIGIALTLTLPFAVSQTQISETEILPVSEDSDSRLDSIAKARAEEYLLAANDKYKNLKFIQYDGTTDKDLFPQVLDVHSSVIKALDDILVGETDKTKLRGYLLDIDPLLIRGAIYYSSEGNRDEMVKFATATVDTRRRNDMRGMPFSKSSDAVYPSIVYCAASNAYNTGDYEGAIGYFEEYLDGSGTDQREQIAMFLGQACINTGQQGRDLDRLIAAANQYPTNYNLHMIAMQNCFDSGNLDLMGPLMERALLMKPDDEQLVNLQASLFEQNGNYSGALEMYNRLYELHPESLTVNRHLALCYYNLGADYYNQAVMEGDEKTAKRKMRQSKAYLLSASQKLETVVDNEPNNPKYLTALAMTYGCLGESERLSEVNKRLSALGLKTISMAGMPETIHYADNAEQGAGGESILDIPSYTDFAYGYVESNLKEFAKRREFEKSDEFNKRMSAENVNAEYARLCRLAEAEYLKRYASRLRITDLNLQPYDADNETYLITSAMGDIVLPVPTKNKEAQTFKAEWNGVQLRNPKFFIQNNRVAIASVDFVTPSNKTYTYAAANSADYDFTPVAGNAIDIINGYRPAAETNRPSQPSSASAAVKTAQVKSDVDRDIPTTSRVADKTVALVWANENYKKVSPVAGALNDGETFAEYCRKTLGIPSSHVIAVENATYAEMLTSMRELKQLVGALGGDVDVIFFYAGHGIPDEATKDAFLLPVDGDGVTTAATYPLKQLYSDLSATRAENVMVFLDACFSGASRNGGMLAEARGVALKPKAVEPEGSMFVLSAASDQETAMPYKEKNHGLFTYYLLKKLQESKGNVTLKDLSEYVMQNVKKNSLTINKKMQTPSVKVSGKLAQEWTSKKMRP